MINHVLLELFCLQLNKSQGDIICSANAPTYECLIKGCPYCSFTLHENALCYVNNNGYSNNIVSLGNEMIPDYVDKQEAVRLWKKIAIDSIDKAYAKYMDEISEQNNKRKTQF